MSENKITETKQTTSIKDVEQLGTFAAIASLSYVFWICGGMEIVERLAYYGVRSLSSLYVTDSAANGGLGLRPADLANIFVIWALVQTFVPVLTGGLSDRYGYKETIFASTVFKILGYLLMAWFPTPMGFSAGAVVLAFGTGIFKPGLQGTIVKSTDRTNSSIAWGVFYQTVNIGAFIGPLISAQLRQLAWENIFYACAAIISLNFLLLLTYKEPDKEARLARRAKLKESGEKEASLWKASLVELKNPVLLWYILLFSGFWFMLMAFWDIAPLYFRDWVDTKVLVNDLFGAEGTSNPVAIFAMGMSQDGKTISPEGLVNLNAFLILSICFLVAGWSAKLKAVSSMALGTFLASAALLLFAGANAAWVIVAAIVCFSFGEMLSSPKCSEYLGNIAPHDKKAMYLGFSQFPIGFGWVLESKVGPTLYGAYSDKDTIAREMLNTQGVDASEKAVPIGEAFQKLVEVTGQNPDVLTASMYAANNIGTVWYVMGAVGLITTFGLYVYGKWTYRFAMQLETEAAKS
ncbi:MFS transporter [Temperatibacter marinus]|uniref:MFS transporter n=1 Tax=Temperatibacter marinus TaxID=1456591 RepID=A0AA52EEF3_9PROT|nr:MFS transporter [Temperatibacter marinus]WND03962.1 MFS transporter [Temperatibacter marinus]